MSTRSARILLLLALATTSGCDSGTLGLASRQDDDTSAVIMAQDSGIQGFGTDPLVVDDVRIDGDLLAVDVRYGGGCRTHEIDAVVWTGWMESNPVQVGIALTHRGNGDPCKALVIRSLRFALDPLRKAYQDAYGAGPATVVLRIDAAGGGQQRTVSYSF